MNYKKRTHAELSHKVGGKFIDRKYEGGGEISLKDSKDKVEIAEKSEEPKKPIKKKVQKKKVKVKQKKKNKILLPLLLIILLCLLGYYLFYTENGKNLFLREIEKFHVFLKYQRLLWTHSRILYL